MSMAGWLCRENEVGLIGPIGNTVRLLSRGNSRKERKERKKELSQRW
jgi:hypothetical protein